MSSGTAFLVWAGVIVVAGPVTAVVAVCEVRTLRKRAAAAHPDRVGKLALPPVELDALFRTIRAGEPVEDPGVAAAFLADAAETPPEVRFRAMRLLIGLPFASAIILGLVSGDSGLLVVGLALCIPLAALELRYAVKRRAIRRSIDETRRLHGSG